MLNLNFMFPVDKEVGFTYFHWVKTKSLIAVGSLFKVLYCHLYWQNKRIEENGKTYLF